MATPTPQRPRITGITLNLLMPDGTTRVHTIDPKVSDALVWSDRAVEVFGKFYDKGGPAEGKVMTKEDLLHHFPHAESLVGDQAHVAMTPQVIDQLWNLPKADGTVPAFLCKNIYNSTNG